MKLLEINSVCGVTSTGRIVADIYEMAEKNQIEAMVAFGEQRHKNLVEGMQVYRIGSPLDNYFHALMTRIFDRQGLCSKSATQKLLKKIDEYEPDIIHIHNLHGYYLNYELLFDYFKKHENIRVFWTLHDCWSFTGHCVYFSEKGCDRYENGCYRCPLKKSYPASYLLDNSCDNFNRKQKAFKGVEKLELILPSKWLEDKVKRSFLKDYKAHVIYNGIDHKVFRPIDIDAKLQSGFKDKFVILGVANVWSPNKGLKYYLELAQKYKDLNRSDILILIVGRVSEDEIKLISSLENVVYIPHTDSIEKLNEIYNLSDVYVSFSSEETFGMTVVEAMAAGTYPIVMKDTACEEVVSGLIGSVCDRKADAVLEEIERVFAERKYSREDISAQALKYTKESYLSNILNLYKGN